VPSRIEAEQGEIIVDRQRITQAVMNLAQNATQHTQVNQTTLIGSVLLY
jgi:signal transduction histidine kinase